ncbi:hypothetical protein BKA67DRAFT_675632 [Truncatella angustata]|uniref:Uncharacterized protein n=1 Tax=Truncatella angustata TaxID=152316 RepID=A0A9P9A031_9PEZI|nr:uncharacterized protein BKA67DRAFT_675632 [Truncatella angustata]KAH6655614.1 hypothetical protein BKA67DRAFT_675632 [Truncatella angustata]
MADGENLWRKRAHSRSPERRLGRPRGTRSPQGERRTDIHTEHSYPRQQRYLYEDNRYLRERVVKLEDELERLQRVTNNAPSERHRDLQEKLTWSKAENAKAEKKIKNHENELSRKSAQILQLKEKVSSLEAQQRVYRDRLDIAQQEITNLKAGTRPGPASAPKAGSMKHIQHWKEPTLQHQKSNPVVINKDVEKVKMLEEKMKKTVQEREDTIKQRTKEMDEKLSSEKIKFQQQLNSNNATLERQRLQLRNKDQKLAKQDLDLTRKDQTIQKQADNIARKDSAVDGLSMRNAELRSESQSLRHEREELVLEKECLTNELKEKNQRIKTLEVELSDPKAAYRKYMDYVESKISAFNQSVVTDLASRRQKLDSTSR